MVMSQQIIQILEEKLDHFDQEVRKQSLISLHEMVKSGKIVSTPEKNIANLHCHSFFSFNGYGYSPTRLAWLGKKSGLKYMGIVDFDVLDGVNEFLDACEYIGLRGSAGLETRTYIPEFSDREINSPGEPGVYYAMGIGFPSSFTIPIAKKKLDDINHRVTKRNLQIIKKINTYLNPLKVDFEQDIQPITPLGNVTERHIVVVIIKKSFEIFGNPIPFWSDRLGQSEKDIENAMQDLELFKNIVRRKLMKQGGVAYIQPTVDSFPHVNEFHKLVKNCRAIPCAAWLDGTSPGEKDIEELLTLLIEKGTAAINIIPDRNWNIADTSKKKIKIANLRQVVELARKLDLPIHIGTEMNSFGQKIVDDFNAPELMPYRKSFMNGAAFIYGHTWMEKRWKMGYQSQWAEIHFLDRKSRNDFYTNIGKILPPKISDPNLLWEINVRLDPKEVIERIKLAKERVFYE